MVNEQSHIDCGAPDLTLLRNNLPLAFVEAKNLEDGDLDGRRKNKEQFDRYKSSLDTVIFTDYLDFKLYRHGEWVMSVHLAEIQGKHICLCDEAGMFAARPSAVCSTQVETDLCPWRYIHSAPTRRCADSPDSA